MLKTKISVLISFLVCGCAQNAKNNESLEVTKFFYGENNLKYHKNELNVFIGAGSSNPKSNILRGVNGGVSAIVKKESYGCVNFFYTILIESNFNFSMGGKILGIYGGNPKSNKNLNKYNNGFSARVNWGKNGVIGLYVYYDNNIDYGKFFSDGKSLAVGNNDIKLVACVNDVSEDVDINLCLDKHMAAKVRGLSFRGGKSIDGIFLDIFFGGDGKDYEAKEDYNIKITNISYRKASKNELQAEC